LRGYETVIVVHPDITDEELDGLTQRMRDLVEKAEGRILRVEKWGKKRLAYRIGKAGKGAYVVVSYLVGGELLPEVDRTLRYHDQVLRYQTVRLEERDLPQPEEASGREEETRSAPSTSEEETAPASE
jgi:small subunit ribosomal protein S6